MLARTSIAHTRNYYVQFTAYTVKAAVHGTLIGRIVIKLIVIPRAFKNRQRAGLVLHTMQTNPLVEFRDTH